MLPASNHIIKRYSISREILVLNMPPLKVVLYNPKSVFYTMPLAMLALGSYLDPKKYEVKILDGRIDDEASVLKECENAIFFGVTVLTGAPIHDALQMTR